MRHKFDPKILKAYDIRGIFGQNLHVRDAFIVGRCFGTILRDRGKSRVCIGRDGRASSPQLEAALVDGLLQCGVDVVRIGVVPTPALYFAEYNLEADGAIMITASHNPAEYNGFKMTLEKKSFYGEDIQNFSLLAQLGEFANGQGHVVDIPVLDSYVQYIKKDFSIFYGDHKPLNVVWDCGNGAMGVMIHDLVKDLPGTHTILNADVDPTFPSHPPDPTIPEHLMQLVNEVKSRNADFGLAFDGDGDRLSVVDSEGTMLWGDQLLQLYATEVLRLHPQSVVIADIKTSQTCLDYIEALGGKPVLTKTGHTYIKMKIRETGALLAGEMSGHMFFCDRYLGFDDAAYAALRAIGIIGALPGTLAHWRKGLEHVVNTPELSIPCEHNLKQQIIDKVHHQLEQGTHVIDIDGLRVVYPHGWWLLRASNTSDKLVARAEAKTQEDLNKLLTNLRTCLSASGITPAF